MSAPIENILLSPDTQETFAETPLLDVAPLSTLRRDLIERFGAHEAAAVMARYGYACGSRVALADLERQHVIPEINEESLPEVAAQSLSHLDMKGSSEKIDENPAWHIVNVAGTFEARHHLLFFGKHYGPACWFTAGYLTGYVDALCPERHYIYLEESCCCFTSSSCRFVGKPKSDWEKEGEGLPSFAKELAGVKGASGVYPIDSPRRHSEVGSIIQRIKQLVSKKATQENVLDLAVKELSTAFGCTAAIEEFGVVTHYWAHRNDKNDDGSTTSILNGLTLKGSASFSHASNYYESKRMSFQLSDNVSGHTVNRIVCPLFANSRRLGYLSLLRIDFPFSKADEDAVGRVAAIFGERIAEQRYISELNGKLMSAFIDDLVTGKHEKSNPALNYSKELDFDLSMPSRMVVVEIFDSEGKLPPPVGAPQSNDWIQVFTGVARTTDIGDARMLIVYRDKHLVAIVQDGADSSPKRICASACMLKERLKQSFPKLVFTIGVGSVCHSEEDYAASFDSACKIIGIGKNLGRTGEVLSLEQFSARTILYGALDTTVIRDFASMRLKPLIDSDREHGTELLLTLETYVGNRGNSHKTAEDLSLSSSGLKYRLKSIEKTAGIDVRDARTFFDVALAIDIMQFIGKEELV